MVVKCIVVFVCHFARIGCKYYRLYSSSDPVCSNEKGNWFQKVLFSSLVTDIVNGHCTVALIGILFHSQRVPVVQLGCGPTNFKEGILVEMAQIL